MGTCTSSLSLKRVIALLEAEFREASVHDLQKRSINVVNLHGGTFDLIVEGKRPFVCEIKRMAEGTRFLGDEDGFKFTEEQTKEILRMKFPPFVIAFTEDDRYYFLPPDWTKEQVEDLKEYPTAIMMPSARQFPPAKSYAEVLEDILKFVT